MSLALRVAEVSAEAALHDREGARGEAQEDAHMRTSSLRRHLEDGGEGGRGLALQEVGRLAEELRGELAQSQRDAARVEAVRRFPRYKANRVSGWAPAGERRFGNIRFGGRKRSDPIAEHKRCACACAFLWDFIHFWTHFSYFPESSIAHACRVHIEYPPEH